MLKVGSLGQETAGQPCGDRIITASSGSGQRRRSRTQKGYASGRASLARLKWKAFVLGIFSECLGKLQRGESDRLELKCERESQETCCLIKSVRLDRPVLVVNKVPEVSVADAGAGQCESCKENRLQGGSGLLDMLECRIRVLGSNHIQENCLFLDR
jgi:hypothetical protein